MNLSRGQRAKIAELIPNAQSFTLGIAVNAPGLLLDFACFGLDGQGKLSDERYMTFFNQPATPCGGVALTTPPGDASGFIIQLHKLPASIEKLTITAAIEGTGTMSAIVSGHARLLDEGREVARFAFTGADFAQERALMLLEIYRKDGVWRVCALGQGFNGGLAALVGHFGGTVAAEEAPPPPPPPKPLSLSKITLEKPGHTVSLEKKAGVEHGEILVNLNWTSQPAKKGFFGTRSGNIDLDLGCLFEFRNGIKSGVQALGGTLGAFHQPPFIVLDGDDRSGRRAEGENLRINGTYWDEFQRILIYAFIYEGVPNWAEADAVITIAAPGQPKIEVRLDSHHKERTMCAVALLENQGGAVRITKLVEYYQGHQDMDRAHHWGLQWVRGSKD